MGAGCSWSPLREAIKTSGGQVGQRSFRLVNKKERKRLVGQSQKRNFSQNQNFNSAVLCCILSLTNTNTNTNTKHFHSAVLHCIIRIIKKYKTRAAYQLMNCLESGNNERSPEIGGWGAPRSPVSYMSSNFLFNSVGATLLLIFSFPKLVVHCRGCGKYFSGEKHARKTRKPGP